MTGTRSGNKRTASPHATGDEVRTRELRGQLSDVLGRAMYGGKRLGVTRNGTLAAVAVGVADLEAREVLETAQDVAAYRAAEAEDDGERVLLAEVPSELGGWASPSSSRLLRLGSCASSTDRYESGSPRPSTDWVELRPAG